MRRLFLTTAMLAASFALPGHLSGQQTVPDAPQPQQKKPAPKPNPPAGESPADAPAPQKPAAAPDDNAFPEAVSKEAAKTAQQEDKPAGKSQAQPNPGKPASSDSNPFPEDVSKEAAKQADKDASPDTVPRSADPPGVSSSQSSSSNPDPDGGIPVQDPARAQKDTEVANFYLKNGNYQGALLRFQEASKTDSTNVAAIFGLAETQRLMGKTSDAAQNYQLYLDIVPNGPRAKEAIKALKTLQAKK